MVYSVKNIAKVCYFFSVCFVVVLLVWTTAHFFQISETNAEVVTLPVFSLWGFLEGARTGIPFALYLSVLISLSYTARKKIKIIPSMVTTFLLAVGWTFLSAWAVAHIPPHSNIAGKPVSLVRDGLIVTTHSGQKAVFFPIGLPSSSLVFAGALRFDDAPQTPNSANPLSFKADRVPLTQSIANDFLRLARNLAGLQEMGFAYFAVYTAGLVVLLVSTRFIMDLSVWALVNLFLGFIAFYGISAFELFIDSNWRYANLVSFVIDRTPTPLIDSLVLCITGLFVMGVSGAVYLIKKRRRKEA
jgi:hypothetical protein